MDDSRATAILDMLTELHGEIAALRFDATDAEGRLGAIEADLNAMLPLVAEGVDAHAALAARVSRLEALLEPRVVGDPA